MRAKFPVRARSFAAAAVAATALVGLLAPGAAALPLPLPTGGAGAESLITEGLSIEGPLFNNVSLPTLK